MHCCCFYYALSLDYIKYPVCSAVRRQHSSVFGKMAMLLLAPPVFQGYQPLWQSQGEEHNLKIHFC